MGHSHHGKAWRGDEVKWHDPNHPLVVRLTIVARDHNTRVANLHLGPVACSESAVDGGAGIFLLH